jgi:hypothetical protein
METYNITFTSEVWYDLWRLTIPNYCEECYPEELTIKGVLQEDNSEYHSCWNNVLEFLLPQGLYEAFGTLPIECYARYANINLHYTDWQESDRLCSAVVEETAKELGVKLEPCDIADIVYNIIADGREGIYSEEEYGWTYHEDSGDWAQWENFTEPDTAEVRRIAIEEIQHLKKNEKK